MRITRFLTVTTLAVALIGCGGGGGGGGDSNSAPPTLTLSATPDSVASGGSAQLNWSSANTTSCSASGSWGGTKATSGSQSTGTLTATGSVDAGMVFAIACTGPGGTIDALTVVTVAAVDTTPNAFNFVDQANIAISTVITSAAVTITGITGSAPVSVIGGSYSVGCGATFTSGVGTITNNQTICVRHTSAATGGTVTNTTLTVGGVTDTFTSTTAAVASTVNLSGTIRVAAGNIVDGDNNAPLNPRQLNDSRFTAQVLPNPATVGGYINDQFSGPSGPSYGVGDFDDYYRIDAVAGQVINLSIADYLTTDLDLYLENTSGIVVDASVGTAISESLLVPASGSYFVKVHLYALSTGASNYTLTLGLNPGTASATGEALILSDDFVPGDLVLRQRDSGKTASRAAMPTATTRMGLLRKAGDAERASLYAMTTASTADQFVQPAQAARASRSPEPRFRTLEDRSKWQTLMAVKALRKEPDVQYVEPNFIAQATAIPNDPYYGRQWHYRLISLPAAWDITTGNPSVVVAVIDTGVVPSHPDLQGQLVSGYDFISSSSSSLDGNGIDPDPSDPGDGNNNGSSTFHGTHVAGTIAAATNNGVGVAGIAAGARVMPVRVLGAGGGTFYDMSQGVRYAAGLTNDSGTLPVQRAAIINLSLGGAGSCPQSLQDVIDQSRAQGVIIVAAAGNDASSATFSPASCSGVVSVSAVGSNKQLASYSNFGPTIDVAAPGGDPLGQDLNGDGSPDEVWSTLAFDGFPSPVPTYGIYSGTSMAAPHIAGVAALMKSVNAGLTPAQFDQMLQGGMLTEDLGSPGRDNQFGYGLINARKAVEAARGSAPPLTPRLDSNIANINFGDALSITQITLSNGGSGTLQVTSASANQPWLSISAVTINASGLGLYNVAVNRSGLATGTYSGTVTVISSANTITIPVLMSVNLGASSGNVGVLTVLLLDPATRQTRDFRTVTSTNGNYGFSFTGITSGDYLIGAGTDLDNDRLICAASEACGAYPTLDQFGATTVGRQSSSGLDFATGFSTYFVSGQAATSFPSIGVPRKIPSLPITLGQP